MTSTWPLFVNAGKRQPWPKGAVRQMTQLIGPEGPLRMNERRNVYASSRVSDVERFAGKPHEPFIEGLTSEEVGLFYHRAKQR
jgi:hypothetical protein